MHFPTGESLHSHSHIINKQALLVFFASHAITIFVKVEEEII